jgi:hypothetical protein
MLLELLSPARYPTSLWKTMPQLQDPQQQRGSTSPGDSPSPATGSHSSSELSQAQSAAGHLDLQEQSTAEAAIQVRHLSVRAVVCAVSKAKHSHKAQHTYRLPAPCRSHAYD